MKKYLIALACILIAVLIVSFCTRKPVSVSGSESKVVEKQEIQKEELPQVGNTDVIPDGKGYTEPKVEVIEEENVIPKEQEIIRDGINYKRWNEEKMCYDESNFPIFEDVPYDETLGYDPNWLVCTSDPSGCVYCMHPNQGYGNQVPDVKE